ncbi:MAG: type II secretion system protein GspK [Verrucomicrobia bacterium]|nr:type II secretion system protein GspK [Verrucomicrobiota bacterium]
MRLRHHQAAPGGSVLIIVLWVAFGLVAITLYFGSTMIFEFRAADNRVAGLAADQAIEGAARYVNYLLLNLGTNGMVPDPTTYYRDAVPIGEAHFWFIGRDNNSQIKTNTPTFALVDEASKLNLNTVGLTNLQWLPNITPEFAAAMVDWRDTDSTVTDGGAEAMTYATLQPPYLCKDTNFESVDELRLVYGATMDLLIGEDENRNGVLDDNEYDANGNKQVDPGILEYVTVFSREPNTRTNGAARVNPSNQRQFDALLQTALGPARATQISARLSAASSLGGRPPPGMTNAALLAAAATTYASPLEFFVRSGMTADEFAQIANDITVATGAFIKGRVNVNTASAVVLACLPGLTLDLAQQLVAYRQANPDLLTSIAWVATALGQNNASTLQALGAVDCITTQSYQFTADVAAVGPHGRGYRRARFVFDTCEGTPKIIYRQDLSHLGWALGKDVRQNWLSAKGTQ